VHALPPEPFGNALRIYGLDRELPRDRNLLRCVTLGFVTGL
jgi:hypothetical protein